MNQLISIFLLSLLIISCAQEVPSSQESPDTGAAEALSTEAPQGDVALLNQLVPSSLEPKTLKWNVQKTSWTVEDEERFKLFVTVIGKAVKKGQCRTTKKCLGTSVNPYLHLHPKGFKSVFADCADLPYVMRAYFAWIHDLPFSYQSGVKRDDRFYRQAKNKLSQLSRSDSDYSYWKEQVKKEKKYLERDIRYFKHGNKVTRRRTIKNGENINKVLRDISNTVSTAMFRTDAAEFDRGDDEKDYYPVAIDREAIQPGTVVYASNGHVGIVSEVTEDGKVYLIDAHPDNSITYISYSTSKFPRSPAKRGGGFLKFRPLVQEGDLARPVGNDALKDWSLAQYEGVPAQKGVSWKKVTYRANNQNMDFMAFLRFQMQTSEVDTAMEFESLLSDLCTDIKARVDSVERARQAGLPSKAHPKRLPKNIYGAQGEWEAFSTPSRDGRLKLAVSEVIDFINQYGDDRFASIYDSASRACPLAINTGRKTLTLEMDDVVESLFELSFDPYHCVEWRWGLIESNRDCDKSSRKYQWYEGQQGLRNKIEPDYTLFTGWTLEELLQQETLSPLRNLSIQKALNAL